MERLTASDIELEVARYFNIRANLIVPNVHWGFFRYECDMFLITKAGYGYEVEIKVTKQDLIRDKKKGHGHRNNKIKYLYFAIPRYLLCLHEHIPERAGIITVEKIETFSKTGHSMKCTVMRKPKVNCNYTFSDSERHHLARLGAMRIWGLKRLLQERIGHGKQGGGYG